MSDYISREQVIDVLKETGIIQDNDLGHLVVDEINRIPTLDEKEIIRKPFERVMERLKFIVVQRIAWCGMKDDICRGVDKAIEIVKEECGINE